MSANLLAAGLPRLLPELEAAYKTIRARGSLGVAERGSAPIHAASGNRLRSGTATSCWSRPSFGRAVAGRRSPATDARTGSWRLQVAAFCPMPETGPEHAASVGRNRR